MLPEKTEKIPIKIEKIPFRQSIILPSEDALEEQRGVEAYNLFQELIKLKRTAEGVFLMIGEKLSLFEEERLYEYLGCETFEEFLGMPELSFSRAWVFAVIRVYRVFIRKLQIPVNVLIEIGITRLFVLSTIVDVINDREKIEDWLEVGKTLSVSDLKARRLEHYNEIYPTKPAPLEVILALSSNQIGELYLQLGGEKGDKVFEKIQSYEKFNLIRTFDTHKRTKWELWRGWDEKENH